MCVCVCVLVAYSCLTLCSPIDCSPPGPSVHGILQARTLEWVAISFYIYAYTYIFMYHCCSVTKLWLTLCDPIDCSMTGSSCPPLSPRVCSNSCTWVGCHLLLQGIFPTQGLSPHLLHRQCVLCHWATWEAHIYVYIHFYTAWFIS